MVQDMTNKSEYEKIRDRLDVSDIDQDFWIDYNQEVYRILDENENLKKKLFNINNTLLKAIEYIKETNFWGLYEDVPMVETLFGCDLLGILQEFNSDDLFTGWQPIEEYDKGEYDWVLVKYFDGDYECVPCVAEKRFGKWYSIDEKEIKFEVKYFFDMQQLDKLQELREDDNG